MEWLIIGFLLFMLMLMTLPALGLLCLVYIFYKFPIFKIYFSSVVLVVSLAFITDVELDGGAISAAALMLFSTPVMAVIVLVAYALYARYKLYNVQ
ncbi:MAG: hypothetical protein AAGC78_04635 [Cellvibrio sp.]|uniref:hypothetical protein n=1 Tax=Cellvibrio sp. TaxID=1965322 RepID=UPI0031A0EC0E